MANKKNNKRKIVAVALGIVGIAGLSMASAAQLTVNTENEVAIGTGTFEACAKTASVDYTHVADASTDSGYAVDQVTVTVDDASCANATDVHVSFDGHAATAEGELTDNSFTGTLNGAPIDIAANLGNVTVIIG